jgi:hypothetical protein
MTLLEVVYKYLNKDVGVISHAGNSITVGRVIRVYQNLEQTIMCTVHINSGTIEEIPLKKILDLGDLKYASKRQVDFS